MGPIIRVRKVYGGWVGELYESPCGPLLHTTAVAPDRGTARLFAWAWRSQYLDEKDGRRATWRTT